MAIDRDAVLVDNLRASLDLYQRSLVWAMTASAAFFVLTLGLGDPARPTISVLYGELSGLVAWLIALALFFVLGILAGWALRNAEAVLARMRLEPDRCHAARGGERAGESVGRILPSGPAPRGRARWRPPVDSVY
jgi:hypothetical protein